MIQLTGIFSESFGGTCTIRGYARYDEIVELSYPHPGYQRPAEDPHVDEISSFITSGSNSFSPEVVLAYTAKYDYYKEGASSEVDAISDIRTGKGFSSNIDGTAFKKIRAVENGLLYTISIPDKKYEKLEDRPFRRVDGNHRLKAIEKLVASGQMKSSYIIPFCLILFADNASLKDEKVIFHNINSKAVPIKSEQLLTSILTTGTSLDFSDKELAENFGPQYLLARKILYNSPLVVRKLHCIDWIKCSLMTTLIDLIDYVENKDEAKIDTPEKIEAFSNSISKALGHAKVNNGQNLIISSGLFFLLVLLYYQIELDFLDAEHTKEKYKNNLIVWADKYQMTIAQRDIESNAAINADCIRSIFDKYTASERFTVFISRCFNSDFDENENAIRRAIKSVNDEKGVKITAIRVDQHGEGATGQISDRVMRDIERSGLVIADLSSGKLNIPHEIGYAMGLHKDLLLIHNGSSEDATVHTPSNICMYEQIRVNGSYQELENRIKASLIDYYKL